MANAGGKYGGKSGVGGLRDRVRFESPVRTAGATGQAKVTAWHDEGTVWAEVIETTGIVASEYVRADQQVPEHTHQINIRGGLAVLHDWRAVWNGRILNVVAAPGSGSGIANRMAVFCKETPASTQA